MPKTTFYIKGTHCASCKALIEDVCKEIPCIKSCAVDFQTGEAIIEHDDALDWSSVKREIEALGNYSVEILTH